MKSELCDLLVDPENHESLQPQVSSRDGERIMEGKLLSGQNTYSIKKGIPRFVQQTDESQSQTSQSFQYKWEKRKTYESDQFRKNNLKWKVERYGFSDIDDYKSTLGNNPRILDAGCGSGFSASLWLDALQGDWFGVDISQAIDVAKERLEAVNNTHFIQADLNLLPFKNGFFDLIISDGVLHHTPSTKTAFKNVIPHLKEGGEFIFYVYKEKAPIREFTDDYLRSQISDLPPEEAWENLKPVTKLGKQLADLDVQLNIEEDIPLLGIEEGEYNLQRFIYYHFAKLFWNDKLTLQENHHVNFDWYHPKYAHRQTPQEVKNWCLEENLKIDHFHVDKSGISVRAIK